jgi:hypothetical protein
MSLADDAVLRIHALGLPVCISMLAVSTFSFFYGMMHLVLQSMAFQHKCDNIVNALLLATILADWAWCTVWFAMMFISILALTYRPKRD